ncbi:TonB-dependent receptor, partial [Salmonella enterica]|nr:TonB-dependent receptor [Salmonella enterica]
PSDKKGKTSKAYNVRARTLGAESGLSWQFIPDWKFDTSLAWSWGQNITEDQPLPQMPPLEGRFALTWDKNDWSTTVLWRVVSQQNRIALNEGNVVGKDIIKSPGFTVLSANAAYKFTKDIKLSIGADNLLNKSYAEHLNLAGNSGFGYSTDTIFNEPGRTYWAKLNVVF